MPFRHGGAQKRTHVRANIWFGFAAAAGRWGRVIQRNFHAISRMKIAFCALYRRVHDTCRGCPQCAAQWGGMVSGLSSARWPCESLRRRARPDPGRPHGHRLRTPRKPLTMPPNPSLATKVPRHMCYARSTGWKFRSGLEVTGGYRVHCRVQLLCSSPCRCTMGRLGKMYYPERFHDE